MPTKKLGLSYKRAEGFLESHTVFKVFMLVQILLGFHISC